MVDMKPQTKSEPSVIYIDRVRLKPYLKLQVNNLKVKVKSVLFEMLNSSQHYNKRHFQPSMFNVLLFGITRLRLPRERIKNELRTVYISLYILK